MQGGIDKMTEAGVFIIGGHTVKDKEPKFGYAVMGSIHPEKILDNAKAQPGDALILTKQIGTGVISTGIKAGKCSAATAEAFTKSMAMLNKRAGEIMLEVGVSTATDITGFGLIGHLNEVLTASKRTARLHARQVPVFEEAITITEMGMVPGGTRANQKSYDPFVEWGADVSATDRVLMNDAQTSGGLLIFVPKDKKERLISALQKENILAAHIGDVFEGEAGTRSGSSWSNSMDAALYLFLALVGAVRRVSLGPARHRRRNRHVPAVALRASAFGSRRHRCQEHHRAHDGPGFFFRAYGDVLLPQKCAREQIARTDARSFAVPVIAAGSLVSKRVPTGLC